MEDLSGEVNEHASPLVRLALIALGTLLVALGVIGAFLPVMPSTVFFLGAAACYARASERFYRWLVTHPQIGPTVREWQRYRSIPWRTKIFAITLMSLTLGSSIIFFVRPFWLQIALAVFGLGLAIYLYRIPSRDRPQRKPESQ
jgi:uncharacterized membrane protein YbaN (DUF454 family)